MKTDEKISYKGLGCLEQIKTIKDYHDTRELEK